VGDGTAGEAAVIATEAAATTPPTNVLARAQIGAAFVPIVDYVRSYAASYPAVLLDEDADTVREAVMDSVVAGLKDAVDTLAAELSADDVAIFKRVQKALSAHIPLVPPSMPQQVIDALRISDEMQKKPLAQLLTDRFDAEWKRYPECAAVYEQLTPEERGVMRKVILILLNHLSNMEKARQPVNIGDVDKICRTHYRAQVQLMLHSVGAGLYPNDDAERRDFEHEGRAIAGLF